MNWRGKLIFLASLMMGLLLAGGCVTPHANENDSSKTHRPEQADLPAPPDTQDTPETPDNPEALKPPTPPAPPTPSPPSVPLSTATPATPGPLAAGDLQEPEQLTYTNPAKPVPPRRDVLEAQLDQALESLEQTQKKLYRAVPEQERNALLTSWLQAPLPSTRSLAMDLAQKRLLSGKPFDLTTLTAIRQRLTDPTVQVRTDAARLLYNLEDPQAAEQVANLLARGTETQVPVLRAYLLLMSRLPRGRAIEPAMTLLKNPQLQGEAAAALAAGIESNLLSAKQKHQTAALARRQVSQKHVPLPQLVTLLGQVAGRADWQLIEHWLDSQDPKVKEAAAQAWANSGRTLGPLMSRVNDPGIGPIALAAAQQRGRSRQTLLALVSMSPGQGQLLTLWQHALLAVAGRVGGQTLLEADSQLALNQQANVLREQLLTLGIDQARGNGGSRGGSQAQLIASLLVRRSDLRLRGGQPQRAGEDLVQIEQLENIKLTAGQQAIVDMNRIGIALSLGQLQIAEKHVQQILKNTRLAPENPGHPETLQWTQLANRIAQTFIQAAQRHITAEQFTEARAVMKLLTTLLGPWLDVRFKEQIKQLQSQTQPT